LAVRDQLRWGAVAAIVALTGALSTASAHAEPTADAASTGPHSELRKTVPITREPGASPRIVLAMGPGRLSGLERGDRLRLSSEVQVTVDCDQPQPRCAGRPYDFDPKVEVSLVLAARKSVGAPAAVLARRTLTCRQKLPNRQHHCPVVFDRTVRVGKHFPCPFDHCFASVVVSAHSPQAHGGERMIIGANKPSGRIVQNKGRLNAIRLEPGARGHRLATGKLRRRSLRLRPQRKVILSQRVDGLEGGDVLAVGASMRSDVRHLGYNALVGAQLIVARGPRASSPSRLVRRSVWQDGLISPLNGTNCTPVQSPCATRKVGVVKVRRDVRGGSGGPAPLFVNLVVRTKQKRVSREHGARLKILDGARLVVDRYP
jgi:hypothetical protein